ncbi:BrnT family toxin [Aurantimonas sp. VKM B-3413]|uniref:BrnT family toxin n=1 Tax=Aurantimonas sp. VKM B-3413 TaxID=2779401 RepID=UPI00351D78F0
MKNAISISPTRRRCAGATFDRIDDRQDYGEERIITIGRLAARMVVVVWTQRDDARHVISMRKANDREQDRYEAYLD